MKQTRSFHLTPTELTGLAAKQLAVEHGLPNSDVQTQLHINTDGKTAEVSSVTITFNTRSMEPKA